MDLKAFMDLIRRAKKSSFATVLLHNHMMIQCYDIKIDSDMGLHYVLHIPDTVEYIDSFYDGTMLLDINEILATYKEGHDQLLAKKKELKLKPKEVKEFFDFKVKNGVGTIKMQFVAQDELVCTTSYRTEYPLSETSPERTNIENTFSNILHRIKIGGVGIGIDAIKRGLLYRSTHNAQITHAKVSFGGHKVKIPLYKSMVHGSNNPDECFISIQETTMKDIYLYTIQIEKNGIVDQYIGYIQNF